MSVGNTSYCREISPMESLSDRSSQWVGDSSVFGGDDLEKDCYDLADQTIVMIYRQVSRYVSKAFQLAGCLLKAVDIILILATVMYSALKIKFPIIHHPEKNIEVTKKLYELHGRISVYQQFLTLLRHGRTKFIPILISVLSQRESFYSAEIFYFIFSCSGLQ